MLGEWLDYFCFQFYWGTTDQIDMLKVYNMMISYLYTLWHDYWNQVNTFINSHTLIFLFVCITDSDMTERLNNDHNLLTIVIILYITSAQLIHLVLKACTCWPAFPISLHSKYLSIYLSIYSFLYISTCLSLHIFKLASPKLIRWKTFNLSLVN